MRKNKFTYVPVEKKDPPLVSVGYKESNGQIHLVFGRYDPFYRGFSTFTYHHVYTFDFLDKCGMTCERFKHVYPEKIFLHEVRMIGDTCIFGEVPDGLFEQLKVFWG